MVIYLVGMSGAGKSTIGREVYVLIKHELVNTVFVDGDEIREVFRHDNHDAYTIAGRRSNSERISALCQLLDRQGINVVCSILSIFDEHRRENREAFSSYFEVFIDARMQDLLARDYKNLYQGAKDGLRKGEYNVIARPHPIAFRQEPKNIELLRPLNFNIDGNATRDMNSLYKVVDWVLCDYGGSSFGALYLDINLLLLDVTGAESQFTIVNSSNIEIREYFPAVEQADESAIRNLLQDAALWEAQKAVRADICDKYFANFRGTSSRRAAEILLNLDKVNPAETSP